MKRQSISEYIEIKRNYFNKDTRCVHIDAWKSDDPDEIGETIAKINIDTKLITYGTDNAKTDPYVHTVITAALSDIYNGYYTPNNKIQLIKEVASNNDINVQIVEPGKGRIENPADICYESKKALLLLLIKNELSEEEKADFIHNANIFLSHV